MKLKLSYLILFYAKAYLRMRMGVLLGFTGNCGETFGAVHSVKQTAKLLCLAHRGNVDAFTVAVVFITVLRV